MTTSSRVTSIQHAHPSRPLLAKLVNRAAVLLPAHAMSPDAMINEAMRKTGLADFGDAPLREPLTKLLASIETEARLHPLDDPAPVEALDRDDEREAESFAVLSVERPHARPLLRRAAVEARGRGSLG